MGHGRVEAYDTSGWRHQTCPDPLDWSWRPTALAQWRFCRRPKRYGTPNRHIHIHRLRLKLRHRLRYGVYSLVAPRVSKDFAPA